MLLSECYECCLFITSGLWNNIPHIQTIIVVTFLVLLFHISVLLYSQYVLLSLLYLDLLSYPSRLIVGLNFPFSIAFILLWCEPKITITEGAPRRISKLPRYYFTQRGSMCMWTGLGFNLCVAPTLTFCPCISDGQTD